MAKRWVVLSLAGIVGLAGIAAVGGALLWRFLSNSTASHFYRSALPASATEVRDQLIDMTPDYTYVMRARITEKEFGDVMGKLGMTPHTAGRVYSDDTMWLDWRVSGVDRGWWDPSDGLDGTYVRQEGHSWAFAKYERGRMYLKSWSH